MVEAAEADLRQALRIASIDLKDTEEFRALVSKAAELTKTFFRDALGGQNADDLDFNVNFIGLLVMSFAERATDEKTSEVNLLRQADLLADMLIAHFNIS